MLLKYSSIIIILLLSFCVPHQPSASSKYKDVRNSLNPFHHEQTAPLSDKQLQYLQDYHLIIDSAANQLGSISVDSFTVAVHAFTPKNPIGTILLVHGYYDHTGNLSRLIKHCVKLNYSVISIDLPGHGLSTGKRASIEDFSLYGKSVLALYDIVKHSSKTPLILMGHSTGCASIISALTSRPTLNASRIIFIAPLIKSSYFELAKYGSMVLPSFLPDMPRWYRDQSHDTVFLANLKKDPLQYSKFPIRWGKAYFDWYKRVQKTDTITNIPVSVIQGTQDDVLDWTYNVSFLIYRCPNIEILYVNGGYHHIANESKPFADDFYALLNGILKESR